MTSRQQQRQLRRQVIELAEAGHSALEIAAATGLHKASVYRNLEAAGVQLQPQPPASHCRAGHRWTPENTRKSGPDRHCRMCEMLRDFIKANTVKPPPADTPAYPPTTAEFPPDMGSYGALSLVPGPSKGPMGGL